MTGLEIALFILGAAFVIISFFIVDNSSKTGRPSGPSETSITGETIRRIGADAIEDMNRKSDLLIAESEDKLEAISNDKIIAVGEYSDQILEKLNNNHKEVVFLYQMLNEKEEELKETAAKLDNVRIECEKLIKSEVAIESQRANESVSQRISERKNVRTAQVRQDQSIQQVQQIQNMQPSEPVQEADPVQDLPVQTVETVNMPVQTVKMAQDRSVQTETSVQNIPAQSVQATQKKQQDTKPASQPSDIAEVSAGTGKTTSTESKTATSSKSSASAGKTSSTSGTASGRSASNPRTAQMARTARKASVPTRPAAPIEAEGRDNQSLSRNEEIISLYRQGRSVMEISKLLGMGQGEVRLIINLYG